MNDEIKFNIASEYHNYGFHRDKGPYPGIRLAEKLKPLVAKARADKKKIEIDINQMRALYGSFFDGAFGFFIDDLKYDFFNLFIFRSENKPEYLNVVNDIFSRHKELNFNE